MRPVIEPRGARCRRGGAWPLLALSLLPPAPAAASDWRIRRDQAGNGVVLPGGVWVAGDATVSGEVPEHGPPAAEIDDLSLLARWEPAARLALFGELRLEDLAEAVDGAGVETHAGRLTAERLYAEVLLTPTVTLRLGKVFTPFGLWNVIDRAPFTWTVEEPAVVEDLFPTRATGLSLLHRTTWHGWSLDATAYGPAQDELRSEGTGDEDADEPEEGWLAGGRVAAGRTVGAAFASVGLNAAGFRRRGGEPWSVASGLDLEVVLRGHQLTGELTLRVPASGGRLVHGSYLQDAIPLAPLGPLARDLWAIVRVEHLRAPDGSAVGGVLGLFWRPVPSLIVRGDDVVGSRALESFEPGLHGSLSLLF